jgi:NADH-quinone oxidoreductase subunit J
MGSLSLTVFPFVVGVLTLIFSLLVVISKNAVISAISLMMTLLLTGVLYFGMNAYFIGAVQILIYAGAIAVLFVFIQMLLDMKPSRIQIPGRKMVQILGIVAGLGFFAFALIGVVPGFFELGGHSTEALAQLEVSQSAVAISETFLTKYMVPFQMTGILILAAILGAVVLGKTHRQRKNS